jgi:hypothetical protein
MALDVAGVARCHAVNLLDLSDPGNPDTDALGHLTLFPIGADGEAVGPVVEEALRRYVTSVPRLMGVELHIGSPERVRFDVRITVRPTADADPAAVAEDVSAAIRDAYAPARYGFDSNAPGLWVPSSESIRHFDVAAVAQSTAQVAGVIDCTLNGGTEVRMSGFAPLPDLGNLDVSVAA